MLPYVYLTRLRTDALLPQQMSAGASGFDLFAAIDDEILLHPGQRARIGTGIAIAVASGYEAQVRPRSGLADAHGITVLNAPGTIDSDYRGEIGVVLINLGEECYHIVSGMRIAQLVFAAVPALAFEEVSLEQFSKMQTVRGRGGFGHTGK
ncbi:MAG: dUTP diphosphatase [Firmicutes bacterium]|nr:dUTP diphosphatase [Bacillota bacterium]